MQRAIHRGDGDAAQPCDFGNSDAHLVSMPRPTVAGNWHPRLGKPIRSAAKTALSPAHRDINNALIVIGELILAQDAQSHLLAVHDDAITRALPRMC